MHYSNSPQGIEAAITAVSAMNNVSVDGVHYRVGLSISLEKKLNDMMNGVAPAPVQHQQPMYYPQQMYYPAAPAAAAPYYAPPSYYMNNRPQVFCVPPPVYPHVMPQQRQQLQQQQYYAAPVEVSAAVDTASTTSEENSSVETEHAAPAPAMYEITLPAAKKLDDDYCSAPSSSSFSSEGLKTLPAAASSELQKQLDDARDNCGANSKHSTIDVYQDMQEHVACVDIIDY